MTIRATRLAVLLGLLTTLPASAQDWEAAYGDGGSQDDMAADLALDAAGNTYVVGRFREMVTFGSFTLTSAGGFDIFLVKYSSEGDVLWAKSGGGISHDYGIDVAVDAVGNVYITGHFHFTATFGPFALTAPGIWDDVFVVKYSPEGDVLWARSGGGTDIDRGRGIAIDADGGAYVCGDFDGPATFGPFTLTGAGSIDVFLVKYTPEGDVLWARSGGGSDYDACDGVAVDAAGDVYLTGFYDGPATFGPFTLTSAGGYWDFFLVKYSADGEVLWAQSGGGPGLSGGRNRGYEIAFDDGGNAYVVGSFTGTATFGPFTLTTAGSYDVFLVKYTPEGDVLWARGNGGPHHDGPGGIAVGADSSVYVTGNFELGATFGSFDLVPACRTRKWGTFLVKYSPEGDVLWARSASGGASGIELDDTGLIHIAGSFTESVFFGHTRLTSAGGRDMFVAVFNEDLLAIVSAAPLGPPVVIPPTGGSFQFTVTLTNTTSEPRTYEVWTGAESPSGRKQQPILDPQSITIPANATETLKLTQEVPPGALSGMWTYYVRAGSFPCLIAAEDSFPVMKEAGALAVSEETDDAEDWRVSGWGTSRSAEAVAAHVVAVLPGGYALSAAHPNPSDGTVRLTLEVAEAQRVTAAVYDGLGRRVAVLLDGAVEAGAHALVFDGSALPAGVYLVRVTGEAFTASRRLTLVR